MKKTKVILFILLFALVIGCSTQVKASDAVHDDGNGNTVFYGYYDEFLQLSEEERNSINEVRLILCNQCEECNPYDVQDTRNIVSFKDLHLEDMKSLERLELHGISKCHWCEKIVRWKLENIKEAKGLPNIKSLRLVIVPEEAEEVMKKMENLEDLDICNYYGEIYDYYKLLENHKKIEWLNIDDKNITDIRQLPELESLKTLYLMCGDEVEKLNNINEITNKFKNIEHLGLPSNLEISYDDLINICKVGQKNNDDNNSIFYVQSEKIIVFKNYENIVKNEDVKIYIPDVFLFHKEEVKDTKNCTFKYNDDQSATIRLDTSKIGEYEAIVNLKNHEDYSFFGNLELRFKYNVVESEPEKPAEPEQPEEPEKPVEPEKPTEPTGGVMSKLLDTIRNLIKSIIDKIMGLFKFKV